MLQRMEWYDSAQTYTIVIDVPRWWDIHECGIERKDNMIRRKITLHDTTQKMGAWSQMIGTGKGGVGEIHYRKRAGSYITMRLDHGRTWLLAEAMIGLLIYIRHILVATGNALQSSALQQSSLPMVTSTTFEAITSISGKTAFSIFHV